MLKDATAPHSNQKQKSEMENEE